MGLNLWWIKSYYPSVMRKKPNICLSLGFYGEPYPMSKIESVDETHLDREFPMSQANFDKIKKIAYDITGIKLNNQKKNLVYNRLSRRIRDRNLIGFDDYCQLLLTAGNDEMTDFVNAITTNLTSFFRENHHFDYLIETVFPHLIKRNNPTKTVRIWSAGCSTGEEPYTISMCLHEKMPVASWDIKILASDLDTNVVQHGKQGVYSADRIDDIDIARKKRWFLKGAGGETVKVKPELQKIISFMPLNLLNSWPMKGQFDVIFCRNVVIYFDKETQKKLFDRFADMLAPDGYLFIGNSETLNRISDRFKSLGKTMYQKIK
jgi:chemotaxis protein methyltransferase CheR